MRNLVWLILLLGAPAFAQEVVFGDDEPLPTWKEQPAPQLQPVSLPSNAVTPMVGPTKDVRNQAIEENRADSATNPLEDQFTGTVGLPEAFRQSHAFDMVAIINKAPCPAAAPMNPHPNEGSCQSLTVYRFFTDNGQRKMLPRETYPVSTGMERWVCEPKKDADGNTLGYEARWTGTPTGYFSPYYLDPDHKSKQYDDASMNFAVFFNPLGIATHQASTPKMEAGLGHRASHGCVRMSQDAARKMFKWTIATGRTPDPSADRWAGDCPAGDQVVKCSSVVTDAINEAQESGKSDGPFEDSPVIPNFASNGQLQNPPTKTGFRTLYIVQCKNDDGSSCATTQAQITDKRTALKNTACGDGGALVAGNNPKIIKGPFPPAPHVKHPLTNFLTDMFGRGGSQPAPVPESGGLY